MKHATPVQRKSPDPLWQKPGMETLQRISLSKLHPSPLNPRKDFGDIAAFAKTIDQQGQIEPIIARPRDDADGFWLVAGERRWRALKHLGHRDADVVVRKLTDQQALEIMLVENKDRESLNALETAAGYQRLADDFGLSIGEIGKRVGISQAGVYIYTSLLKLPEAVRGAVATGKLTASAAHEITKAPSERLQLAAFGDAMKLAKDGQSPSLRAVQRLVKAKYQGKAKRGVSRKTRDEQSSGAETALRGKVIDRMLVRVAESIERERQFSDEQLRLLGAALAEILDEAARKTFQRRNVNPARLAKVGATQLRGLIGESILRAWMGLDAEKKYAPSVRAVAKMFDLNVSEIEKAVAATDVAEGLFDKK